MQKNYSTKNLHANLFRRALLMLCFVIGFNGYANAQNIKVSGTVSEESGESIMGAVVKVPGGAGTSTNVNGQYELSVPVGSTLEFSLIGYVTETRKATAGGVINVTLRENVQELDELVVIGYSTVRKQSVTGALAVVNEKKLLDATTPNVENMLQGKSPGVYVNSGSGRPGEEGKVIIRGKSTLNGSTDPLWVVDGVIMGSSAYNINPSDIENLTILKDAASTAVYGSQGANGVILVTTKGAKAGKTSVNVSAKFTATRLDKGPFKLMNGEQLYDHFKTFLSEQSWFTPDLRDRNYDWWDESTQTGFIQNYNISLTSGSEKLKSYASVGFYDESSAIKTYNYKRFNALLKVEFTPVEWLSIKPSISGSKKRTDDRLNSPGSMNTLLPWDSPYDADGKLVRNGTDGNWVNGKATNFLYDNQWNYSKGDSYEVAGSLDFDVRFTDYLTFSSINNYKFSHGTSNGYTDPRSNSGRGVEGRIQDNMSEYNRVYTNQLLKFNKMFGKHFVNAVGGYEWNEYNGKSSEGMVTGFVPGKEVASIGAKAEKHTSSKSSWAVKSWLFNSNYSYDDRYMGQVSVRRDGASNFGKKNRYGTFYSVSGGWNIHNEEFFKFKPMDQLKLRLSYGTVGNRPSSLYGHLHQYSLGKDVSYNEKPGALLSGSLGNPNLAWEKSASFDIGLEMSFLNRFRVNFDYYYKKTKDLLYEVPIPAVTGMTQMLKNDGDMKNQGFEVSLSADIIKTDDWFWSVDANLGLNRNEVISLGNGQTEQFVGDGSNIAGSAEKIRRKGLDSDTWYLREWAGVDPANGDPLWFRTDNAGNRVTTNVYNQADRVAMGSYTPKFFGGFSTYLSYKDFDLSANFSYNVGGKIFNYARVEFDSDGAYLDRNQMKLHNGWNRWEKAGDIATHPKSQENNKTSSNKASSRQLETGTYLKMRNLTLGYNVPKKLLKIATARVFFTAENVFTISHFSGVDPEIPPRNGNITGVYTNVFPKTRKFLIGVDINF